MSASAHRLALSPERRGMLAKVHLARKQLGLDEDAYRTVVQRITGGPSAGSASDAALHRLLGEFGRLGFKATPPRPGRLRPEQPQGRMIAALWTDLGPYLRDGSEAALRAFVQRQTRRPGRPDGVSDPNFLRARDAARVIEALKAWLARARAGEAAP